MGAGYKPVAPGLSSDTTRSRSSSPARRACNNSHPPTGSPSTHHQALHLQQPVCLPHASSPHYHLDEQQGHLDEQQGVDAAGLRQAEAAVTRRLLPWLVALVVASFLDRTNLAFASVTMSPALGLSATLYGLGSGLFFLGYATCQIPSNLLLLRWGGPTWLAALAATWGTVAAACAAITGPVSFLLLRAALGAAEAGALPGIWYYVTCFWPPTRTTLPLAVIETGITGSQVLAAPLSAAVLSLDGVGGLAGWRWLFLLEGLPALGLAVGIWWCLPPSVEAATFLTPHQKQALAAALAAPHTPSAQHAPCQQEEQQQQEAQDREQQAHLLPRQGNQQPAAAAPEGPDSSQHHHHEDHKHQHQQQQQQGVAAGVGVAPAHPSYTAAPSWPPGEDPGDEEQAALVPGPHTSSSSSSSHPWHPPHRSHPGGSSSRGGTAGATRQQLLRVVRHRVVWYAGCWRVLHDIPGYAVLYFTPLMVAALLKGASSGGGGLGDGHLAGVPHLAPLGPVLHSDSSSSSSSSWWALSSSNSSSSGPPVAAGLEVPSLGAGPVPPPAPPLLASSGSGVGVVLLSAIPYAAASLAHVANAWHSAATGEWRWHIAGCWWAGAGALLLLPPAAALHPAAGFLALTAAHVGVNGANGLQTGLVARCLPQGDKALGLAAYNSLGSLGGLVGPVVVGALVDATGGYGAAARVMGVCLGAAGAMVWCFQPGV